LIKITHFQRKRRKIGNFSIEAYFNSIRQHKPQDIDINLLVSKYESSGIIKRIYITLEAFFNRNSINHITGDVHFLTLLLPKKNTILTIHDCGTLKNKTGFAFVILKYFWFSLPAKKVGLITVNSNATKKDVLSYINYPEQNIKVIYLFVNEKFTYQPKVFNKTKPNILQVGTAHNKNIDRIIEAIKNINCTYTIVGKLPLEIINKLDKYNIAYKNYDKELLQDEIVALYNQCDILSFASTLEGFGIPIVEANVVGRAVITSNVYSMPEVANDAACIVNPFDVEDIRQGFLKIIDNDSYRDTLIKNGIENAKRFDKTTIVNQYYTLYRNFANK
jgi:glycosyltransferase involved in cell wall biosynthesis